MQTDLQIADEILVQRAIGGDEQAASQLYYRHADRILGICYRVVLNTALARDCAQEVWLKVFRELHRYQERYYFRTWVSTIAVRTAIDEYRKRSRRPQVSLDEELAPEMIDHCDSIRLEVEQAEIQARIEQALADLSETQRAAFVLRHFEGEDIPNISKILGCNPGTAKTHIHRAIQSLRKSLSSLQESSNHV